MFLVFRELSLTGNSEQKSAIIVWDRYYDENYKVVLKEHLGREPILSSLAYMATF